ncbi:hypothetical protein STRTUCAR8_01035 [Streptomyces turgidiscabies Car8]|uniref:Uncharacterized protein n=1 Tax=Streptomyces turgidiscabies (strain Car8) TaxID=698760 RepID=L7F780_STRT8|nr:hypothetical protein STRTUCAR8_01035 [Streptomyces turgidiscabies Car8]
MSAGRDDGDLPGEGDVRGVGMIDRDVLGLPRGGESEVRRDTGRGDGEASALGAVAAGTSRPTVAGSRPATSPPSAPTVSDRLTPEQTRAFTEVCELIRAGFSGPDRPDLPADLATDRSRPHRRTTVRRTRGPESRRFPAPPGQSGPPTPESHCEQTWRIRAP